MIQTTLGHIQINVQPENISFYRDLTGFLGWTPIFEAEGALGVAGQHGESLWFMGFVKEGVTNDYDGPGMNHLAFGAAAQADIDAVVAFLNEHGIACLFETPRHRPEFSHGEGQTYYQVMFETPDRLLIEVVYIGAKQ